MSAAERPPRLADRRPGGSGLEPFGSAPPVMTCEPGPAPSTYLPCDAARLELRRLADGSAVDREQIVRCVSRAARDTTLTEDQRARLGGFDLLLQTVAEFIDGAGGGPGASELEPARIVVAAAVEPGCPRGAHDKVELTTSDAAPRTLPLRSEPVALLARTTRGERNAILREIWILSAERRTFADFGLASCGVRDGAEPNVRLRGRVEVLPKETWEVELKVPPLLKTSHGSESVRNVVTGDRIESKKGGYESPLVGAGLNRSSKSVVNEAKATDYTENSVRIGYGSSALGYDNTAGVKAGKSISKHDTIENVTAKAPRAFEAIGTLKRKYTAGEDRFSEFFQVGLGISIRRNGRELAVTEALNGALAAAGAIRSALEGLLRIVPKAGVFMTLDLSICEGRLELNLSQQPKPAAEHPRLWLVERDFFLDVEMKLIAVKHELAFGFEAVWGGRRVRREGGAEGLRRDSRRGEPARDASRGAEESRETSGDGPAGGEGRGARRSVRARLQVRERSFDHRRARRRGLVRLGAGRRGGDDRPGEGAALLPAPRGFELVVEAL